MLAALLVMPAMAAEKETPEEIANKDYTSWLPQEGDWSVGFALNPITAFVGNMFNNSINNGLDALYGQTMGTNGVLPNPLVSIMGTYMITDSWELRLNAGFGINYKSTNFYADDQQALLLDPLSQAKVVDKSRRADYSASIAFGPQYRVGTRRVQGIFGCGLLYAVGQNSNQYLYGNGISDINQTPAIAAGMGVGYVSPVSYIPQARMTQTTVAAIHRIGLYGTVGVEWFVAPKIALGANVNLDLHYDLESARNNQYEGWNILTSQVDTYTEKVTPAGHGITFSTDNIGANLYVAFYF